MTLTLNNLAVSYGKTSVLEGVETSFESGQFHALIGPNGSGKSTLLKAMAGLLPLDRGHMTGVESDIARAQQITYLPQNRMAHPQMKAADIVALGREPYRQAFRSLSEVDKSAIEAAILKTDINDLRETPYGILSGGQQARVLLARALAVEARIILVDEPVAALDPYYQLSILNCLKDEARKGRTIIAALHDLSLTEQFTNKIHVMNNGRLVVAGDKAAALSPEILKNVFRVKRENGIQTAL